MDKERILSFTRSIWNNVNLFRENIYRGELRIGGASPAGICFLDLTNNINFEHFEEYQEQLLADEYYKSSGHLQWNYYLFLLQDQIDSYQKEYIERDDNFARKYLMNETEFKDFFTLDAPKETISSNILVSWKEKLTKVGLEEVFSQAQYTEAVENYIEGKQNISKSRNHITKGAEFEISSISNIKLNNDYRVYPKIRNFNFGKVNLFKGINGVGKTSLLEALELIICGTTARNPDRAEKNGCIEAKFSVDGQPEKYSSKDLQKYRDRDAWWYKNRYMRGNFVAQSFNRFNFFNTDAASNFSQSADEEEVRKALYNLVLGPEFNYITDRIVGFKDRIRPAYNSLIKELENHRSLLEQTEKIIKSANNQPSNLKNLQIAVIRSLEEIGFLDSKPVSEDNISESEISVNNLRVLLEEFEENIEANKINSISEFRSKQEDLQQKRAIYDAFKNELKNINNKQKEATTRIEGTITILDILESCQKYFENELNFLVKGHKKRVTEVESGLKKISAIKDILGSIQTDQFLIDKSFNSVWQERMTEFNSAKENLSQADAKIKESLARLDRVSKIISEIKILGKQYIDSKTDINSCPLCNSEYTRESLLLQLSREIDGHDPERNVEDELINSQKQFTLEFETCKIRIKELESIKSAFGLVSNHIVNDFSLKSMIELIDSEIRQEVRYLNSQAELENFQKWTSSLDISEEEFSRLENQVSKLGNLRLEFVYSKKDEFQEAKKAFAKVLSDARNDLEKLASKRYEASSKFKEDFGLDIDESYTLSEIGNTLDGIEKNYKLIDGTFKRLSKLISLNDNTLITEIASKISLCEKNIQSMKSEHNNHIELKRAEKDNLMAKDFIEKNLPKLNRIEKGYLLLTELSNENDSDQLMSFFNSNLKEVSDVFRTIHSPREFSTIKFIDGKLRVVTESGEERLLTQISTGQRAALAISLFITLNRKLNNGPNIIIFDDPVAHIDDFNALSFLDFLRYFVLTEKKQLFFATANTRLASLFEKKFGHLGDQEFISWELTR